MKVRYVGHPDGCDLVLENDSWKPVAYKETVDVSDELGASLLEQPDNWKPAGKSPATGPATGKKPAAKKPAAKKTSEPKAAPAPAGPGAAAAAAQTTP